TGCRERKGISITLGVICTSPLGNLIDSIGMMGLPRGEVQITPRVIEIPFRSRHPVRTNLGACIAGMPRKSKWTDSAELQRRRSRINARVKYVEVRNVIRDITCF